jgi:hypothetical protein
MTIDGPRATPVNVVQAIVDRSVLACGSVGGQGAPLCGVGPELMVEEIANQGIHGRVRL